MWLNQNRALLSRGVLKQGVIADLEGDELCICEWR